jgi:hypothetical protein
MWTPLINESSELTQGALLLIHYRTLRSSYVPGIYVLWRKATMSRDLYWSLPVGGFHLCRFFRRYSHVLFSVSDPYLFIWYGSGFSILGWIPIRIQSGSRGFDDQKLEKIYSWKIKLNFFGSKTTIYLSLYINYKGRPSYRRCLQLSKENIQHFKKWNFWIIFYFLGSFFALLDPDPDPLAWFNQDPI